MRRRNMILFRATSHHQLINAIALKINLFYDQPADLMLSNMTDFSSILNNIEATHLFRKIYYVDDVMVAKNFISLSKRDRYKESKNVKNRWNVNLDKEYDDYYYGYDILCNKLFYYYLVKTQHKQVIPHAFQEGNSTYIIDIFSRGDQDGLAHSYYKKSSLLVSLCDLHLYIPECIQFKSRVPVRRLSLDNPKILEAIQKIYDYPKLPKQNFIYVACCSEFQGVSSNEMELLNYIADCVGKENIVIKGHPRFSDDKFSYKGFAVLNKDIAWEAYVIDNGINDKVIISGISTSLISTASMISDNFTGIIVNNLFRCDLARFINNKKMNIFLTEAVKQINNNSKRIYTCNDFQSLHESLNYWKGKLT